MNTYNTLDINHRDGVDWVTLNRPEFLNSINYELRQELSHYFEQINTSRDVRVVVLRGAGKGYCGGFDIKAELAGENNQIAGLPMYDSYQGQRAFGDLMIKMRHCPQPIISCVHGAAAGGGLSLALASDIRVASPCAKFSAAYIRRGIAGADMGSEYFLPRLIGAAQAARILLTGRTVEGEEALKLGLVSDLVDKEQLEDVAREYAEQICLGSRTGVAITKEALHLSLDAPSLETMTAMENRHQTMLIREGFFEEGIKSLLEGRPAAFKE